jgi:hypothetical protein
MRKIIQQPKRTIFRDEDDIMLSIQTSRGQLVSNGTIYNSEISTMVDGESRIDFTTQSEVIKMDGKLYERVIADNKVKLQEIK